MGFAEIALPLVERGVAVVPTDSGLRFPFRRNWQNIATTDAAQIAAWHEQDPNQNCCSVARAGGVGFLDIDHVRECEALGMPALPDTFTVASPKGLHVYFRHTPETETLGDYRAVKVGSDKILEFKGNGANAVCSPGCVRDDGGKYVVAKDLPIAPLTPQIIAWIEKHAPGAKTKGRHARQLHPEFDEQDLFEHYGWTVGGDFWKEDAHYFLLDSCPIKGAPHDRRVQDKKTVVVIGDTIGFKCVVCDSVTWREVVAHMRDEGIAEYPYFIYADEDDELLLADAEDRSGSVLSADELTVALNMIHPPAEEPTVDITGFTYDCNDTGNGERFIKKFGHRSRYVRNKGVWRVWNGRYWADDTRSKMARATKAIVKDTFNTAPDGEEGLAQRRWAIVSGGAARRDAMLMRR